MTPRDAYTISRDVSDAHNGGFALVQRFPQPLLDCDSSVKRKELLPNDKVMNVFLHDCVLFLLFPFFAKQAYNDHDTLLVSRTLEESEKP
jgi:hypothetical protein